MTFPPKKLIFGSNLKMYKTNSETMAYLGKLQDLSRDLSRELIDLFILPSCTALADACRAVDPSLLRIGAQNVHWMPEGQFTGEISVRMLKDIGVNLVMIGHAERRQHFGETDVTVNKRVLTSLEKGLQVLLCVGDTALDQELGVTSERLALQLRIALNDVLEADLSRLWIAYEPVWAIGKGGKPAEPGFLNRMHGLLRTILTEMYPNRGSEIPRLYGGSVNLKNAEDLITQQEIDGLFVGRAAWDAENFNQLIRLAIRHTL